LAVVVTKFLSEIWIYVWIGDPHPKKRIALLVAQTMLGESVVEISN
jgi:hypothetical protein